VLTVTATRNERRGLQPEKRGRQDCWRGADHAGNVHVSTVTLALLEAAFCQVAGATPTVRVRADGAFFPIDTNHELSSKTAPSTRIAARLTQPLKNRLSGTGVTVVSRRECGQRSFAMARRDGPGRDVHRHSPTGARRPSAQCTCFRCTATVTKVLVTTLR